MDYEVKSKFKIFILADTNAPAFGGRIYGVKSTNKDFDNHEDAFEWIRDEGERQTDYVILEVTRKA